MDIAPIQRNLDASEIPLERLANNSQLSEQQKVAEVARQFEAVLLRQILENTQKPVISSAFTDNSTASGIYRGMVTAQLADSISKSGNLGLSKSLERQLTHQLHSLAGGDRKPEALPTAHANSDAARPSFADAHSPAETVADFTHERSRP